MTGGWWRRNRWGLIGLVPALGLALAVPVHDEYGAFWNAKPRDPVAATAGWVSYDGASMHLDALTPALEPGLPAGLGVWRATVDFRSTSGDALEGCAVTMEDASGSTYDANPVELTDLGLDVGPVICAPDGKPAPTWRQVLYFLAPGGVRPVAVRVVVASQLPEYVRLSLQ
jgi:hypothetical protein